MVVYGGLAASAVIDGVEFYVWDIEIFMLPVTVNYNTARRLRAPLALVG
jgi:hypothetical protein